jgi:prepilin-type N-terminal cleavage/methylation domain-containing protein
VIAVLRTHRARRSQLGFTMIEMLITVAVSSLVGVLIYTVFIEQTRAYRMQADMGNMQQNLRIGMEMVTRDVATAGFGAAADGGTWGAGGQDGNDGVAIYAVRIRNAHPNMGPDTIEIMTMDPDRATWVYTSPQATDNDCEANQLLLTSVDVPFADTFSDMGPNDRIMCHAAVGFGAKPHSYVWMVDGTGDTSTGYVPVVANDGTPDYDNECIDGLPTPMVCGPLVWVAYYIDDNGTDSVGIGSTEMPVLYLVPDVDAALADGGYPHPNDIPVALGIEDLQFSYCEGGGQVDCGDENNWSPTSHDYDLTGTNVWQNLTSIRVLMTARTLRPDLERSSVSSPIDLVATDGAPPIATPDPYHRRVARTEVTMRNAIGTWQLMHQPF